MDRGIAVVAVGGNSLIKDNRHQTIPDQYEAAAETMRHVASMIEAGWEVVIMHGNGPQVGFVLRRSELALGELHPVPFDDCGADTQVAIGYMFQRALYDEFQRRGIRKLAATVVTQTLVDGGDPAFRNSSKPIGSFMDEGLARARRTVDGWTIVEDAGRGWRRVVPSPEPVQIVEQDAMLELIRAGFVVICVGGGGSRSLRAPMGFSGAWKLSSTRTWVPRYWPPASARTCFSSQQRSKGSPRTSARRTRSG